MAVLRAIPFCGLLAACYSPDLPDCRVPCAADTDCAPDQTCGAQGMCAQPMMTCPHDSGAPIVDGTLGDAPITGDDAIPDAPVEPTRGMLTVHITDRGRVDVSGLGACDSETLSLDHMDCNFVVELGATLTLYATPGDGRRFEHWSDACTSNEPICIVTPQAAATKVSAKFRKD